MAVNNKPAEAYAGRYKEGLPTEEAKKCIDELDIAVAGLSKGNAKGNKVNPHGVLEMRGFGAATKGKKISGKMG
jgi:hypothetical protein